MRFRNTLEPEGESFEFWGKILKETKLAYLVFDGDKSVWLPKSQIEERGAGGTFTIPQWLAEEKGLV